MVIPLWFFLHHWQGNLSNSSAFDTFELFLIDTSNESLKSFKIFRVTMEFCYVYLWQFYNFYNFSNATSRLFFYFFSEKTPHWKFSLKKNHQPCRLVMCLRHPLSVVNPGWSQAATGQWKMSQCASLCRCSCFGFKDATLALFHLSFVSRHLVALDATVSCRCHIIWNWGALATMDSVRAP